MRELITKMASLMLLDLEAVQVSIEKPFKLASGNYSPIYVNCRRIISDVASMDLVTAFSRWIYESEKIDAEVIAGGESAGIPFASFLAQRLSKPMVYVRKKVKGHGIGTLVEGQISSGVKVLLVEDLITDGKSKLDFITPLRDVGAIVETCLVVFDRLQGGSAVLNEEGVRLHSLTDIRQTLIYAESEGRLNPAGVNEVLTYLQDPKAWHVTRALPYIG